MFQYPLSKRVKNKRKGVSNPLIKTALRLSSAKITLKVVLETLILRQKCDDKRTHVHVYKIQQRLREYLLI